MDAATRAPAAAAPRPRPDRGWSKNAENDASDVVDVCDGKLPAEGDALARRDTVVRPGRCESDGVRAATPPLAAGLYCLTGIGWDSDGKRPLARAAAGGFCTAAAAASADAHGIAMCNAAALRKRTHEGWGLIPGSRHGGRHRHNSPTAHSRAV